ncbi:MAG: glycosyltransferase, partial [Parcubacteria group bacterium Gr01-1014_106]
MRGLVLRSSGSWKLLGEVGLIFLIALLPRLYGIGLFLTADEKNWMGRGVNFVQAVQEFHFNETFQTTHPGIPTLWIAGVSARGVSRLQDIPFRGEFLHVFTSNTQYVFAVLTSLLIAALFLSLRRLAHPWIARIAACAIALDPFLLGYSKVVHVDALLALCAAVSFLLFLAAVRERESPLHSTTSAALVWSSIMGALAILSKLPGLILLPMAALVLFAHRAAWRREELRERVRLYGQWIVVMGATILLLWPGILWVPDPIGNVKTVRRDVEVAVTTSHNTSDVYSDVLLHYPRTILTRTTIPTLVGVAIFVGMAVFFRRAVLPNVSGMPYRTLLFLGAYVVLFTIGMTFGSKKGDRYLLP